MRRIKLKKNLSVKSKILLFIIVLPLLLPQVGAANEGEVTAETATEGQITEDEKTEKNIFQFNEVIVTATKILQEARKVPASVTVITAEKIKEMNIMTIDEALRNSVGIFVDRPKGIAGVGDGIKMRGFSDNNILVLLDGQPMNTAYDGSVNWNAIPIGSVERIEVVRGGASSLYGGYAVGGVINIMTKEPKDNAISADITYGSNDTWRKSFNINQKVNDYFSVAVGYEERSTNGHVVNPASSTLAPKTGVVPNTKPQGNGIIIGNTVDGKTRYIFGDKGNNAYDGDTYWVKMKYKIDQDKSLSYNYTKDKLEYRYDDAHTFIHDANGNPIYNGYAVLPDGRYFEIKESDFTNYFGRREADIHALQFKDDKNHVTMNAGFTDTTANGYSSGNTFDKTKPGSDSSYPSKTWNMDLQKSWRDLGKHTVVTGFNWRIEEMNQTSTKLAHWNDYHSVTSIDTMNGGKDRLFATFIQDEYQFNKQWSVIGGLRYDQYTKYDGYSRDFSTGRIDKEFGSTTYNEVSPKLAFEYQKDPETTYYVSYGHSFNPPSLYKLYRWTTTSSMTSTAYDSPSNPNLKPETSDTFEIGLKKQIGQKTNVNLALYQAKTQDMIARVTYPAGSFLPDKMAKVWENIDSATRKGIELDVTHNINSKWDIYTNYALQKGKWDSSVEKSAGTNLSEIPTHLLHFGGNYHHAKWSANLDAMYVSERNDDDSVDGVYGSSDAYFTVNTKFNYTINSTMTVSFGVNNIFDRKYYSYYDASGREYTLGMQYRF